MDSKSIISLAFFLISVSCQYDVNHLINSTQHLQDLERGGDFRYQNIYPQLNTSEYNLGNKSNSILILRRPSNSSKEILDKFINHTLKSIPNGICVKEVPTASLLKTNDHNIRGNGSDPSLSRIQTCCEGYQRNKYVYRKCEPVCSKGCENGICTAPETCTCYPDYLKNEFGDCVASCPVGCANGFCNADNTCSCYNGFVAEPNHKFCIPKCDKKCLNGRCSGPNQCSCNKGYVKDATDSYRCVPTCNPPCENGICSGPNMCLCYAGYVKDRRVKSGTKCIKI